MHTGSDDVGNKRVDEFWSDDESVVASEPDCVAVQPVLAVEQQQFPQVRPR